MPQRLLLTRKEAAAALNVSLSHFQRHIQPHLACVYSGQLRLYRPADLDGWAERAARAPAQSKARRSRPVRLGKGESVAFARR